ncbi:hypothetical protein [Cytobacillus firmus]|uniref:hypothetical protein n=1 Tax=Cytobacillus firmus TaxID=1399 RepID=UPI002228346F|nr:hypothetical protein [Cytobacillus firmus]
MRVRTGCIFGQKKQKSESASPNLVQIRTEKREIGECESELGASSDRKRRNRRVRVRTWSSFGQEKEKSGSASPNRVLLRTGKREIGECESELGAFLDRKRINRRVRVRTGYIFGQKKEKSESASPNRVLLWTGKGEIEECESEPGAYSDRRGEIGECESEPRHSDRGT